MAGLMDFLQSPEAVNMAASLLESGGPSPVPIGTGQAMGRSLLAYQQGSDLAMQRKLREAQIAKMMQQQEDEQKQREFFSGAASRFAPTAQQQALAQNGGPTIAASEAVPTLQDQPMDMNGLYRGMLGVPGMEITGITGMQKLAKEQAEANAPIKLGEGETLLDPRTNQPIYSSGPKLPWYVERGEGGQPSGINPLYRDFELMKAKTGAARTNVNIDTNRQTSIVEPFLKTLPETYKGALNDKIAVERLNTALDLVKKGGDSIVGVSGAVKRAVAPYAAAAGMNTESMNDAQILKTLLDTGAGSLRMEVVGPGPVSNYEQGILQSVSGGKMAAAAGVKKILEYHKKNKESNLKSFNAQLGNASKIRGYEDILSLYPQVSPEQQAQDLGGASPLQKNADGTYTYTPRR